VRGTSCIQGFQGKGGKEFGVKFGLLTNAGSHGRCPPTTEGKKGAICCRGRGGGACRLLTEKKRI